MSSEVLDNPSIISDTNFDNLYPNISVLHHENLQSVKRYIVKNLLSSIRETDSSLRGNDCIVLIESTFLKGSYKGKEDLRELLIIKDIEELSESNIGNTANKLRYTSILKFKGLEKKNVYMVISMPSEINRYEIFVGITRAMLNLEINIVK